MAEYVVVLDDDSRQRLLQIVNAHLARKTNVASAPLLRARDALTWAITTEAAEGRTTLALDDWLVNIGQTDDLDFSDAARHVVFGLRNVEPPTDETERTS